ncbi:MAG: M20/M25/M40 family metallo-hydrolase [Legionella sp.]|uniref:M20/M25/M40 family metallo-hydrolase n=1 Tax=Legionella sp. TaxID=459 RepID=UPI0028416141|nr:M20/M25/M40 family metallo-hydrolase [Legionella sp.]
MKRFFLLLLMTLSFNLAANQLAVKDKLIVTKCMYEKLENLATLIIRADKYTLIEIEMNELALRVLHDNRRVCGGFLNLEPYKKQQINESQLLINLTKSRATLGHDEYHITHDVQVTPLLKQIDRNNIWGYMQHLTNYVNRAANSQTGVLAAQWFKDQIDSMAKDYHRNDVQSYMVETGKKYKQPSVVTVIGKEKPGGAIVIGAHIDTLKGNMPGADDDASGIAAILEVSRMLLSSGINFDRPIYVIAYAAEEQGLVGSGFVVQSFLDKKTSVKAVLQFDQAGFRANPKDKTIWLLDDYVDSKLTKFLANLTTHYVNIPVSYTHCGYACSDHANWHLNGFAACYPSATTLDDDNDNVHTSNDRLETISLDHIENFAKLGLAFVVELGLN